MIDWNWISTTGSDVFMVVLSGVGIYATLLVLTRLAGVSRPEQVFAVVLETTGDISILRADADRLRIDPGIFDDVRDGERLHLIADAIKPRL